MHIFYKIIFLFKKLLAQNFKRKTEFEVLYNFISSDGQDFTFRYQMEKSHEI